MAFDYSDWMNAVEENVISVIRGFASLDPDLENPRLVKGFPTITIEKDLQRPLVAVYVYNADTENTGYDNVVDGNGLPLSDPNWEVTTGVAVFADLYVDVCTQKGTAFSPVVTGGATVAKRIAGKIQTRLALNPECLDEALDLVRAPIVTGPYEPTDSRDQPFVLYRVDLGLLLCVSETINGTVLV